MQRATVAGVAARAGVSVASVSRVMNGLPTTEATRTAVQAAAAELDYRPSHVARALRARSSHQLALAIADVGNPVYVEMMRAIEDEARARGYRLLVTQTGGRTDDVLALLDGLGHGYADGLVLSPVRVDDALVAALREVSTPLVVIGTIPPDLGIDTVRADSAAGVALALHHLHDQGVRRVAFLNGPADTVPGSARRTAFEATCGDLGLDPDPALRVEAGDFTVVEGRKAAGRLLDQPRPDAVLAGNDLLAVGAMQTLTAAGVRVPDDVLVVGMDDTELAEVTTPALSSVGLGAFQRGRAAAQLLLDRLEHPDRAPQVVTVAPHLSVRDSSRRPTGRRSTGRRSTGSQPSHPSSEER